MNNSMKTPLIRLAKREGMDRRAVWAIRVGSILLALLLGAVVIAISGVNPFKAYGTIITGALGKKTAIRQTVKIAVPLLGCALAIAPCFKMRFWNIGAEGQITAGAIAASYFALYWVGKVPSAVLLLIMGAAGAVAGGIWALIPAFFKARWNTNETLFTLMMNYIIIGVVRWLQGGPWEGRPGSQIIPMFDQSAWLPEVFGVHCGWIIVLVLVVVMHLYMNYTKHGYEIAVIGDSLNTARYAGMNVGHVMMRTMFLSGAISGLVGFIVASGANNTLYDGVANGVGFTSIYSGSAPSTPYCTNDKGQGPAWANSLFEDNAEFGLGMHLGVEKLRDRIQARMEEAIANCTKCSDELKGVMKEWIAARGSSAKSAEVSARLVPMMEACGCDYCKDILEMKDWLVKKSQWIIGGDGWGYDIGFGGVDHVLASGADINILVVDTEVYSNTGGQSSKSTPVGAVAKFASAGKRIRKKDLGAIAMTYGYVYVAQVSIGASQMQLFNVLKEAEAYPGPSLVIAYAPCINHGIKGGMTRTQTVGKEAVACGYWHLWHYNPQLEEQGKNPFVLDSKEPDWSKFRDFLMKEVRYTSLKKSFPAEADELFAAAEQNAKWRYNGYQRLAKMEY